MSNMSQYKLVYFPAMGRAEPIRLVFAQANVPYEDHRIELKDWISVVKPACPMGSIPYLEIDGKKKLCQTHAICGYIGQMHNLAGEDAYQSAECYMYAGGIEDFWVGMTPYFLCENPAEKAKIYKDLAENKIKPFLARYERCLQENGTDFFVGNDVTWADLVIYHGISFVAADEDHFDMNKYPSLTKFMRTISSLPRIKTWLEKRPKTDW